MTRFINNVKTALLMGGLMGLCLAVGSQFGQQGLILALIFGGLMNVGAWFFSDTIALRAMGAQEVGPDTPGAGGELYRMVDELRQRAGLPMPKVCICPHEAPNAFATGRSPSKAAVAVTEGALRVLNYEELRGVMAHELAHVKNRDTLTSCIAATVSGVLAYLAHFGMFLGGRRDSNPLIMLATVILAAIGAALIKAMISRSREYVADHDGAVIAGSPRGLMSALQRLEAYNQRIPLDNPNPAQNNLFIVEPLTGASTVLRLFASHPPMEKRIAALARQEQEMARAA
ncbi:MAG: M48 family metalloprotease [Planctomycetota bacterium]|nr:M48 family metalloprotease [Planctomycetota bacterium]